jgi:hypothetical protein
MRAKPVTGGWLHGPKAHLCVAWHKWCRVPSCPRDGRECNRRVGQLPRGPGFHNIGDLDADRRAVKGVQSPRTRTLLSIGESGHTNPSHGATKETHQEGQDLEIDNT